MGFIVYILYERGADDEYRAKRREDGGLYLFREATLADQIARAFRRGGQDVAAISFDLAAEYPNLS